MEFRQFCRPAQHHHDSANIAPEIIEIKNALKFSSKLNYLQKNSRFYAKTKHLTCNLIKYVVNFNWAIQKNDKRSNNNNEQEVHKDGLEIKSFRIALVWILRVDLGQNYI
jgi:hypothetical protein